MNKPVSEIARKKDGSLPRMKPGQRKRVNTLIRARCCNFNNCNCILFDDICPQTVSGFLYCQWFRWVVLPLDAVLENILIGTAEIKRRVECGRPFIPNSNRAKYCSDCAFTVHRRQKTERER